MKTPKGWPSDTKIDPGRWVFWLPEGWKQAKRTQEDSGKVLTCFFNEENKRFWHKRAVEKFLGRSPVWGRGLQAPIFPVDVQIVVDR